MVTPLLNRIPDTYETRSFSDDLRSDEELGTFTGHASMFWNVDSYGTGMAPKTFQRTLAHKEGRIPVLFFHEPTEMIGPARVLREDSAGLYHESKAIEDGRTGSYVLAHMRGGTPMGMSFGFRTLKDRAATEDDPLDMSTGPADITRSDVRIITEVELYEISVLPWTFASNSKADIANIRSDVRPRSLIESLLEELRSGSLNNEDERWPLLQQLVSAFADGQPDSGNTTPLPPADARRRNPYAEYMLLAAMAGQGD